MISNSRRVFAVLPGLAALLPGLAGTAALLSGFAGLTGAPALADPPPPAPFAAPLPGVVPKPPSPAAQKAAARAAQRLALHRQAQAAERDAARGLRVRQFDQAQRSYGQAASLYHQQARQARQAAQDMAHAGQMGLAARAHAEALAADNRYLACLAGEVSAIKKSSQAEAALPKPMPPARPLPPAKPVRVAARVPSRPFLVPKPVPIAKPVKAKRIAKPSLPKPVPTHMVVLPPKPMPTKHAPAHAAALPPHLPTRPKLVQAKAAPRLSHMGRARKALPPALKALRQAAARPFKFTAGFIAAQQHGQLQEMLRLRRAQLQGMGTDTATPEPAASP